MATETVTRLDVGALTASIRIDAQSRVAQAVSSVIYSLHDEDNPLDEKQSAALLVGILDAFDGFERAVARSLIRDLHESGVPTWGLPRELADLEETEATA